MMVPFEVFIKEIVKRERMIWRRDQKITRMKQGTVKHHQEMLLQTQNDINVVKKELNDIKEENASMALALLHNDEILETMFNKIKEKREASVPSFGENDMDELYTYLKKAWIPIPDSEKLDLNEKLKELRL